MSMGSELDTLLVRMYGVSPDVPYVPALARAARAAHLNRCINAALADCTAADGTLDHRRFVQECVRLHRLHTARREESPA